MQGGLIAVSTMAAFYMGLRESAAIASTMAFATLTLARLFHGFNCRSSHSIFKIGFSGNRYSLAAFGAGVLLLSAVLFIAPLQSLFAVETMNGMQLLTVAGLALLPTVLIQLQKVIADGRKK